ncbi:MAG TPA: DUF448 domain-containing protein [Candidatus Binataceae bacterium]|nr:DUF448 domain-containing protein [Candidatus Binataceae bacterium]
MSRRNHNPGHTPVRTCLGCGLGDAQAAMVRLAAVGGAVSIDAERRRGGRGGYLHPRPDCLERFARSKTRAFRSLRVALDVQARRSITQMLSARLDSNGPLE